MPDVPDLPGAARDAATAAHTPRTPGTPQATQPPEGYEPMPFGGPYFRALGQAYGRRQPNGCLDVALCVSADHVNMQGVTHGGMLMTLADGALTLNAAMARGPDRTNAQVTVSMNADFLSAAKPGDWLEAKVELTRVGKQLAFANCNLWVGSRLVLRSAGVFSVVKRPAPPLPIGATGLPASDG